MLESFDLVSADMSSSPESTYRYAKLYEAWTSVSFNFLSGKMGTAPRLLQASSERENTVDIWNWHVVNWTIKT